MPLFNPQSFHYDIPAIARFAGAVPEDEFESPDIAGDTRNRWLNDRDDILAFPYQPTDAIRSFQLRKAIEIIEFAFKNVPLYRELYRSVGFKPGDVRTFNDMTRLPEINKSVLADADFEDRKAVGADMSQVCRASTSGSRSVSG